MTRVQTLLDKAWKDSKPNNLCKDILGKKNIDKVPALICYSRIYGPCESSIHK